MRVDAFRRKLVYTAAIVVLLLPLYLLGQPRVQRDGKTVNEGGKLAQIRERYHFGQADLGKLDPASESMKLATLGFRGVAAAILWNKADYYKKEQYWDRYSATLNQIALLQPNFVTVWEHQAHNLTYNISVEFDGYKQRYEWVKKGIDYLIRGTEYNQRQPILQWDLGIYTGQKIGVADEKKQYRQLFRNDEDYHNQLLENGMDVKQTDALGSDGKPDHWLVGRQWFLRSYELVDRGFYCKKSPHIYYSDAPKCQLRYTEAIQDEGILDDSSLLSWERASRQWSDYGDREIMTTWGHTIKMKGLTAANKTMNDAREEFLKLAGETRDALIAETKAKLTDEEQVALDTPHEERTMEQRKMVFQTRGKLNPPPLAIAQATPREIRDQALELAGRLRDAEERLKHIESYRTQVNYQYWETRAIAEQQPTTLEARQQMFQADQLLQEAKLDEAIALYDKAWVNWYKVLRRFPIFMTDDIATDIMKAIKRYKRTLDSALPDDFVLKEFMQFKDMYDRGGFDFEVEQILTRWTADSFAAQNDPNFFESDLLKSGSLLEKKPESKNDSSQPAGDPSQPTPSTEPTPDPSAPAPASADPSAPSTETTPPAATASEPTKSDANASDRPPQLESPSPLESPAQPEVGGGQ